MSSNLRKIYDKKEKNGCDVKEKSNFHEKKKKNFLNRKRKRSEKEEKEPSDETHTETNDTLNVNKAGRENQKDIKTIESLKKEKDLKKSVNKYKNYPHRLKKFKIFMEMKRKWKNNKGKKKEIANSESNLKSKKGLSTKEKTTEIQKRNSRFQKKQINNIRNDSKSKNKRKNSSLKRYKRRYSKKKDKEFEQKLSEFEKKFDNKLKNLRDNYKNLRDNYKNNIDDLNSKISLLSEIVNQKKIYFNKVKEYILSKGIKFDSLYNSCKVMFVRKICDFILDGLIRNYKLYLVKTKDIFKNNNGITFNLIVFRKDVPDKYAKNLLIDYIMEIKQQCSLIIHMNNFNEINIPIMKELFYIIMNDGESKDDNNNNNFNLNIKQMTNIILECNNDKEEKLIKSDETNVEVINTEIHDEIDQLDDEDSYLNKDDNEIVETAINKTSNIKKEDLIEILKEEVRTNKKGIKEINNQKSQTITPSYFYNLWIKSFQTENYKKSRKYKNFIKEKYILSSREMNNMIIQLLPNYEINFFDTERAFSIY